MISSAVININTAGMNEIVGAVAGAYIEVIQYTIVSPDNNIISFVNGDINDGIAITGPMQFSTNESIVSVSAPSSYQTINGLFVTSAGKPLSIYITENAQVSGHLTYRIVYV